MENLEVYFNKLPRNCIECPCFQNEEMCCGLDDGTQDYFKDEIDGGICPIHSIEEIRKLEKNQTQLAIRELEKVKNFICDYSEITGQAWNHTLRFLNNKIKELKGEKDEQI